MPKKGERMRNKLDTHKSYMTTYRMYKDSERELRFPLAEIGRASCRERVCLYV